MRPSSARDKRSSASAPRLNRLRGELLRVSGRESEALREFMRALAVSREQGSLLFELRTTVSLGRLLQDTGRAAAARKRLRRILARFEVDVDSADLREARALLAALGG
jgi:tetratricopeptide repeat protein